MSKRLRPHSAGSTLPHLWPTCSSSGSPPLITARYFSSDSSDSGSLRTPCPPPACAAGRQGITPAFGYSAPHPSAGGTLTLLTHTLPSTHYAFPDIHWQKIRTNNPLERIMKEIRRRTRVVGAFPDGQSCLNLAAARLR